MKGQPSRRNPSVADADTQLQQLRRGVVEIISEKELREKLSRNKPLIIKAGFDPTAPDLHLGHTVLLRKLRQFQGLSHQVKFLIGDATALVGDPSGQSKLRKLMTTQEIEINEQTYIDQVGKVLDVANDATFERVHNSAWFARTNFSLPELVTLTSRYTVARLLERDDFQKRIKAGQEISILEELYPLMQGYDSVMMRADVELGGTDQKFNLLVGRDLQRAYGQEPQVVMTLPLLLGADGVHKMSKSLGNHIGITDSPKDMFGKLMSIPDALMDSYATLLTDLAWKDLQPLHPKEAKVRLAKTIVTQYHSAADAERQAQEFDRVHRDKQMPIELMEITVPGGIQTLSQLFDYHKVGFEKNLNVKSRSELRRLLSQRGLKLDGQVITDLNATIFQADRTYTLQAGPRRFLRISLQPVVHETS